MSYEGRLIEGTKGMTPTQVLLSGIANNTGWRRQFDAQLVKQAAAYEADMRIDGPKRFRRFRRIYIGSGPTAAVHAANAGLNRQDQLVLESSRFLGGTFASGVPLFRLNSRNRPNDEAVGVRVPGTGASLNHLPGCMFQAEHINGDEYQFNSDLAFACAANIAIHAWFQINSPVTGIYLTAGDGLCVYDTSGRTFLADEVYVCTGLGEPEPINGSTTLRALRSDPVLAFRRMDRVAVLGQGDTGKVMVELFGGQSTTIGPAMGTFVERIDWWGVNCEYRESWKDGARPRYSRIAELLESANDDRYFRVHGYPERAETMQINGNVYVRGVTDRGLHGPYDLVVNCTTPQKNLSFLSELSGGIGYVRVNGEVVGRKFDNYEVYIAGPAANLPFTQEERRMVPITLDTAENKVAIWRYGRKNQLLSRRNRLVATGIFGSGRV